MKRQDNPNHRPAKAIVCIFLNFVLLAGLYICAGCPSLTMRQEFNRAQRVSMLGPSTIVDTVTDYDEFDKMYVGESEYGITFFGRYYNQFPYRNTFAKKHYLLTYVQKQEDMTIAAAPNIWGLVWQYNTSVPVYLFTEYPAATRAELIATVSGKYTQSIDGTKITTEYCETFQTEADRSEAGYFRFLFSADTDKGLHALAQFSDITCGKIGWTPEQMQTQIPATIRLYDAEGNCILEKELVLKAGT